MRSFPPLLPDRMAQLDHHQHQQVVPVGTSKPWVIDQSARTINSGTQFHTYLVITKCDKHLVGEQRATQWTRRKVHILCDTFVGDARKECICAGNGRLSSASLVATSRCERAQPSRRYDRSRMQQGKYRLFCHFQFVHQQMGACRAPAGRGLDACRCATISR